MMLKDIMAKAGDFCFDNRGLQYLPYFVVIIAELDNIAKVKENVFVEVLCFAIVMMGILVRIFTIGYVAEKTSGRNRGCQIAESLNQTGMYSIVRNPLYLGNYLIFLGITAMTEVWEVVVINTLFIGVLYTLIILREEEFLANKFGDEYKQFASRTNCMIPSFKNFIKSTRKFSIKQVIRNEHDTWLTTILAFVGIEIIRGYFETQTLFLIPLWVGIFALTVVIWAISKTCKKRRLLEQY